MDKRIESAIQQKILIVSPVDLKEIPVDPKGIVELIDEQTKVVYKLNKLKYTFSSIQALSIAKREAPEIIIVNAFMNELNSSIHKSLNLIQNLIKDSPNSLIIVTSTIKLNELHKETIINYGAHIYLKLETLTKELLRIIQNYETIFLYNKDQIEKCPDLVNMDEIKQAYLYINKQNLTLYFKRHPGERKIKINPWKINHHQSEDNKNTETNQKFCFEIYRNELI